jgi:hypothetical protein
MQSLPRASVTIISALFRPSGYLKLLEQTQRLEILSLLGGGIDIGSDGIWNILRSLVIFYEQRNGLMRGGHYMASMLWNKRAITQDTKS